MARRWRAVTVSPGSIELEAWLVDEGLPGWEETEAGAYRFYLSPEDVTAGRTEQLRRRTPSSATWHETDIDEEDWAEGWKQYFKPTQLTVRLAVCPTWEDWTPPPGVQVIRMDPGMAFGTGGHATTRLCLELLERHMMPHGTLLDVGTGSGILAIGAKLLGAGDTVCTDSDALCIPICRENLQRNGLSAEVRRGESLEPVRGQTFDTIVANLVTVALLELAPQLVEYLKPGGLFVGSGTTMERVPEVLKALHEGGLSLLESRVDGEWAAVAACR